MVITPYQLVFKVPDIEKTDTQTCYGVPDVDTKTCVEKKNGEYIIQTHDRHGSCTPGNYYQVAFEITDPSPFRKEDLRLSIDRSIYQSNSYPVSNDLYYDKKIDLWYQRSRYTLDTSTGKWKLESENRKSKYTVDCITASGVFRISVFHNGTLLNGSDYDFPWVYVLPSSVSKENYLHMVSDLIALNERLVAKERSAVGMGARTYIAEETDKLADEIKKSAELLNSIKEVMKLPSELLGKKYVKTNVNKVKHFDGKTVLDYLKYGMSGTVSGIEYYEDHDTYENRVIKYALRKLSERISREKPLKVRSEEEIETEINRRRQERTDFMEKMRISCSGLDRYRIYKEIEEEVRKNEEYLSAINRLFQSRTNLVELLDDEWFSGIYDIPHLSEIRLTPKFAGNNLYSAIYKILTENYVAKPFFSASFDVNAIGIRPTQQVYEYWVFYKLLSALLKLGFVLDEKGELKEHFSHFTRKDQLKPLKLKLYREAGGRRIDLEFGYNVTFRAAESSSQEISSRTPDYYLRIISGNHSHWYFLDAKYKDFISDGDIESNNVWYASEVFAVSVKKYIRDMTRIFISNPEYNSTGEDIRGSYVIMAHIEEDNDTDISSSDRLFGNDNRICNFINRHKSMKKEYELYAQAGLSKVPRHRYGAIELVPDNEQELMVLYQLIFEYLETDNNKEHPNFNWCWRCSFTDIEKKPLSTMGNNIKYYTTCPSCGDFKVITNCTGSRGRHLLVKHEIGNYHRSKGSNWSFVCPVCGDKL